MAKSARPAKKTTAKKTVAKATGSNSGSVAERLARALSQKPAAPVEEPEPPRAAVGDKVTFPQSDTVYTISRVSPNGRQVDLRLEGTNIERFRVNLDDLAFLERSTPRAPARPAKPSIDIEEIREHLTTAHHSSMDHLAAEIAILKKYLKDKGVRASALKALDDLCDETQARWAEVVAEILDSLPG